MSAHKPGGVRVSPIGQHFCQRQQHVNNFAPSPDLPALRVLPCPTTIIMDSDEEDVLLTTDTQTRTERFEDMLLDDHLREGAEQDLDVQHYKKLSPSTLVQHDQGKAYWREFVKSAFKFTDEEKKTVPEEIQVGSELPSLGKSKPCHQGMVANEAHI